MSELRGTSATLLTIEQVAAHLQVHPRTVRRAIRTGGLRAHQVAGRGTWRVREPDLEAWLEARANRPRTPVLAVAPLAAATARPRPRSRRGVAGVLSVTDDMGRAS